MAARTFWNVSDLYLLHLQGSRRVLRDVYVKVYKKSTLELEVILSHMDALQPQLIKPYTLYSSILTAMERAHGRWSLAAILVVSSLALTYSRLQHTWRHLLGKERCENGFKQLILRLSQIALFHPVWSGAFLG